MYASSAGSGKTWTLAKEFLTLSLKQETSRFREILAVTFTNKATQEMKDRIIRYLTEFSEGKPGDLGSVICAETGLTHEQLKIRSRVMLSEILHRYHDLSVSTIDSFFQRVIRAFTREAGLNGNFTLELDTNTPLRAIIGSMMDDLGKDEQLTKWITEFASERLQEGKSWNIADNLRDFAKVIFTEEFKLREARIMESMEGGKPAELQATLKTLRKKSMEQLITSGQTAMAALSANNITVEDFSNGDKGTAYKFFREWSNGKPMEPGNRVKDAAASADHWTTKRPKPGGTRLIALASQQLIPLLIEMLETAATWHTCSLMLKDFNAYGLLAVILKKYQEWKAEQNVLLIADAPQFLNKVIGGSDTPFLYEKTGTRYHHFLIDEFQDTSRLQWMNFRPLVMNALAEGNRSLVVGDVKQSIYRFRGSDPALLGGLANDVGIAQTETKQLSVNYRSADAVITFNNLLFETAAQVVNKVVEDTRAGEAYAGVAQKTSREEKGHVEVRFFSKWEDEGRELALNTLPHTIEQIQLAGGKPGDITILVRDNKEGTEIVRFLLEYKHSPDAKPGVVYDIVSGESLRLEVADSVSFLLACLKVIVRPSETLARGEAVLEWWRIRGVEPHGERISSVWSEEPEVMQLMDPSLRMCSVPELTEELIRRFRLGDNVREIPYLQAFQDALMEFNAREKNDLNAFFDWWEDNSAKKSVKMPETTGAMKLYSIHKSKGLEFPYVIIPFCDWKLDHKFNPLLWCEAGEEFESFGLIPIRYGKKLEPTVFNRYYQEEQSKIYLDNLNLMYVAFTRASEALFIMAGVPGDKKETNDAGTLLYRSLTQVPDLNSHLEKPAGVFRLNDFQVSSAAPKPGSRTITLEAYSSYNWRERLSIKMQGRDYFNPDATSTRERVNTGILVHQVLSKVRHHSDLEPVLRQCREDGTVISDEVQESIRRLMEMEGIRDWFSDDWHVRTEATILSSGGQQKRLDRVMTKTLSDGSSTAVVVDYKTGERHEDHAEQVKEYANQLSSMGYSDVRGWLVYLDPAALVEVSLNDSAS